MTTKTLSTYISGGYVLAARYDTLDVTHTGGVLNGLTLNHYAKVFNDGVIGTLTQSANGITATAGAYINNTRRIAGYSGVFAQNAPATVVNSGTIFGDAHYGDGVYLSAGGEVFNGSTSNTNALIEGTNSGVAVAAGAFVANYGRILASQGVELGAGDFLYNETGGSIYGTNNGVGSNGASVQVHNRGYIAGRNIGIYFQSGGVLNNYGLIRGALGVLVNSGAASVINAGGIESYYGAGVELRGGGSITNSGGIYARLDDLAVIGGGLRANGGCEVGASGELDHYKYTGVYLQSGGVTNGAVGDTTAMIYGHDVGVLTGSGATVTNFGTVRAISSDGVHLGFGGAVTNGSSSDKTAFIYGYSGVFTPGAAASVVNFGTIEGSGAYGDGVFLVAGGVIANGSDSDRQALIEGPEAGVTVAGPARLINYGTITGLRGTAVQFGEADDTLVVEAGCAFFGAVIGGGGILDLDSGTGALTGKLASGTVTVSGSMAATPFQGFDTVEIGVAATFATAGAVSLSAGQALVDFGSLVVGAGKKAVANGGVIEDFGGTLTVDGAVTGAGSAVISAGLLDFAATFSQNVTFLGQTGTLELAKSRTYRATIAGFSKAGGTRLDLVDIGFVGAGEATFKGNRTGGVLTVSDGTHTTKIKLTGDYRSATFLASSDGRGGTVVVAGAGDGAAPPHAFISAMAGFGAAAGQLVHGDGERPARGAMLVGPRIAMA